MIYKATLTRPIIDHSCSSSSVGCLLILARGLRPGPPVHGKGAGIVGWRRCLDDRLWSIGCEKIESSGLMQNYFEALDVGGEVYMFDCIFALGTKRAGICHVVGCMLQPQ